MKYEYEIKCSKCKKEFIIYYWDYTGKFKIPKTKHICSECRKVKEKENE